MAAVAIVIALTFNVARSKGLTLTRSYFDAGESTSRNMNNRADTLGGDDSSPAHTPGAATMDGRIDEPSDVAAVSQVAIEEDLSDEGVYAVGDHGFYEVTFSQAARLFRDPATQTGGFLFVDARDDDSFDAGHIPGALQIDHYFLEQYLPDVLPAAFSAEKVIVYCNGGKCEDSILVCNDLLDEGVEWENLLLFKGGWKAWTANDMSVEKGSGL